MSGRYRQDTLFLFLKTPNPTLNFLEATLECSRFIPLFGSQSSIGKTLALLFQEGIAPHFAALHSNNIHQWNLRNRLRLSVSKFLQKHYFCGLCNVISARCPQQNGAPQGSTLITIFFAFVLHAIHKAAVHLSRHHYMLTMSPNTRSTFVGTLRQSNAGSMSL